MKSCESRRILEALLFSSTVPLHEKDMAAHLDPGTDIRSVLDRLDHEYRQRGIHIEKRGNGLWAMRTAPDLASYMRITHRPKRKLGRAVMEILAICAYHQPITRREIEDIRGVPIASSSFDILLQLEWIKPGGRRKSPGRPVDWVTTDGFLDHFSLQSLDDLPPVDELRQLDLLQRVQEHSPPEETELRNMPGEETEN